MDTLAVVRWVHLVAAAVWLGGLITLAALVVALRREGADRALLQASARMFARVSWTRWRSRSPPACSRCG